MQWRNVSAIVSALAVLGYMGLIYYLSSIPGTEIALPAPDYVLHALAFGGLSFLFSVFFLHYLRLYQSIGFSMLMVFLYGLGDEAHQFFTPNRVPDWRDIAADVAGALIVQIGVVIFMYFYSYRKSRAQSRRSE